eukprot:173751_1
MSVKEIIFHLYLTFNLLMSDISFNIYNNSIFDGTPTVISLTTLNYSIQYDNHPISGQILGSILWNKSIDKYYFECRFDSNIFGFVWIDDHIICAPNVYPQPVFAFWNLSWTSSAYNTRKSFIRIDLYSKPSIPSNIKYLNFSLLWSLDNNITQNIINNTYLSKDIPSLQTKRMTLQNALTYNTFSTWYFDNMLSIIRMPDSFGLTFGICMINTSQCLTQSIVENDQLWVGVHAYDHSYMEYNLSWNGYNIAYQYASLIINDTYSNFYAAIKILTNKTPFPYIAFSSRFYWMRSGQQTVINTTNGNLTCFMRVETYGISQYFTICSNIKNYVFSKDNSMFLFHFTSTQNTIYFTTDTNINSISNISIIIDKLKDIEYSTYIKYGNLSNTKIAIQSSLMWNLVYCPEEAGPYNTVNRAWSSDSNDFAMIIFEWDNIFASYELSLDCLDLAISNLIQVIKSKTTHGFIPNFKWVHGTSQMALTISEDRSEPPIGAMVLYKMYEKYGNKILWLIQLLFHDLYDWQEWFWRRRRCKPKNLIC